MDFYTEIVSPIGFRETTYKTLKKDKFRPKKKSTGELNNDIPLLDTVTIISTWLMISKFRYRMVDYDVERKIQSRDIKSWNL